MKCLSFQKDVNILKSIIKWYIAKKKKKSQHFDYITSEMYLNHFILIDCYAFQKQTFSCRITKVLKSGNASCY